MHDNDDIIDEFYEFQAKFGAFSKGGLQSYSQKKFHNESSSDRTRDPFQKKETPISVYFRKIALEVASSNPRSRLYFAGHKL